MSELPDPITVALIGAAVTALGWLMSHVLAQRREQTKAQKQAALDHVERQLEELYGPLTFALYEGRRTFKDLLDHLGRRFVFEGDRPLPKEELETWLFWAEKDFLPRNERIQQLLMSKTHLIDGAVFPKSYVQFLDHHSSWAINHLRWKEQGVAYAWRSKINWPFEFENDVIETFERLKKRHAALLGDLEGRD